MGDFPLRLGKDENPPLQGKASAMTDSVVDW
jgi:hypothetical protein